MSELSDGYETPGKEPGPKLRRKRPNNRKRWKDTKQSGAKPATGDAHSSGNSPFDAAAGQTGNKAGSAKAGWKNQRRSAKNPNRSPVAQRRLYAALDLGTNNCRLLIATPQQRGRFRVVDGFSKIVRLGEGLAKNGALSDAAMDRAVAALKICAYKLANRNIRACRLIATEACRQAENGDAFLVRVKQETGLELEIVTRETEAWLAAEGCAALFDRHSDGGVLFDIGGGSSELILLDASRSKWRRISEQIVAWTSLPMGVVTLAEKFGGKDVNRTIFEEMVACVSEHINVFEGRDAISHVFASGGNAHLLGTSGTVTTLAGIHLELPRYDRWRVDGLWMCSDELDATIEQLIAMSYEERAANPCIGTERADLVLAGCAILNAIRLAWPTDRLRVADRGLREGLLIQMMSQDGCWRNRRKSRSKRNSGLNLQSKTGDTQ